MVLRLLHEGQAGGELDDVVQQCAAARQRGVPGDAVLLAIDLALELDADPLVAPGILVGAVDLGRQRDLRCPSRASSCVTALAVSMLPLMRGCSPPSSVAWKSRKRPRTVEIIMWRTPNSKDEWAGSTL
jgi:hypothetical protein